MTAEDTTQVSGLSVKPVKITSIILVCCGLLNFLFGIGFVIVRVMFQAYPFVIAYHIWCGLIIATSGALGMASYKMLCRKILIAAGSFGIIAAIISSVLSHMAIRLLFENVGRTTAWMAEPEAEARAEAEAKAETTAEPTAEVKPEGEVTHSPIPGYEMDIFLQISVFLTVVYVISGVCGVILATFTFQAGCKKQVEPFVSEKPPV